MTIPQTFGLAVLDLESSGFLRFYVMQEMGGALFYSFSLPIVIIVAVGCTMLLIIVWSLHRVS